MFERFVVRALIGVARDGWNYKKKNSNNSKRNTKQL